MTDERTPADRASFVPAERVEATATMQDHCVQAYLTVMASLRPGMSENDIAGAVMDELDSRGITRFWYDIPVVVLIGPTRFMQMVEPDYEIKKPSAAVFLQRSTPVFIDIHPQHEAGFWGNFAATGLFASDDEEAVSFLRQMQQIQQQGIEALTPDMTGGQVAQWFQDRFQQEQIELVDVRGNFGHSMEDGSKKDAVGTDKRSFLDEANTTLLGGRIWGIEPGGIRRRHSGAGSLIARFEDCVYISPQNEAILLGREAPLPVRF